MSWLGQAFTNLLNLFHASCRFSLSFYLKSIRSYLFLACFTDGNNFSINFPIKFSQVNTSLHSRKLAHLFASSLIVNGKRVNRISSLDMEWCAKRVKFTYVIMWVFAWVIAKLSSVLNHLQDHGFDFGPSIFAKLRVGNPKVVVIETWWSVRPYWSIQIVDQISWISILDSMIDRDTLVISVVHHVSSLSPLVFSSIPLKGLFNFRVNSKFWLLIYKNYFEDMSR